MNRRRLLFEALEFIINALQGQVSEVVIDLQYGELAVKL